MNWLKRLFHKHDLYVIQEFTYYSRRVGCSKCNKTWGMNDQVHAFLSWDTELEELYKLLGHKIIKPWRVKE
jgi:hypothetical protein